MTASKAKGLRYGNLTAEQKLFCQSVASNSLSNISKGTPIVSKRKIAERVQAAFKHKFGVWVNITDAGMDSIRASLTKGGHVIMPAANGKGLILTDKSQDAGHQPDLFSHADSVAHQIHQIACQIKKQVVMPTAQIAGMASRANINIPALNGIVKNLAKCLIEDVFKESNVALGNLSVEFSITAEQVPPPKMIEGTFPEVI